MSDIKKKVKQCGVKGAALSHARGNKGLGGNCLTVLANMLQHTAPNLLVGYRTVEDISESVGLSVNLTGKSILTLVDAGYIEIEMRLLDDGSSICLYHINDESNFRNESNDRAIEALRHATKNPEVDRDHLMVLRKMVYGVAFGMPFGDLAVEDVSKDTGLSIKTIGKIILALKNIGYIDFSLRFWDDGSLSCEYQFPGLNLVEKEGKENEENFQRLASQSSTDKAPDK